MTLCFARQQMEVPFVTYSDSCQELLYLLGPLRAVGAYGVDLTNGRIRILDPRITSQVFYQFATLADQFAGVTSSHA